MHTLFNTVEGPLTLDHDTELFGVVSGDLHVTEGTHLIMGGLVMGDLTVASGADVEIDGVVMGHIINNGGIVKLSGEEGYAGRISVVPPYGHRVAQPRASFWGALRRE